MLLKLWNKIRGIKTIDLDNDGKIETFRAEIEGVFSQFVRMNKKLDEVNGKLQEVITEEKTIANRALQRIEKAEAEIQANTSLQKKVSEFIVK
jgi:hypothetical protein